MNQLIQLALALATFTDRIVVHTFNQVGGTAPAYQVIVNGDLYLYNEVQGFFKRDGNYAPAKTAAELQERLNKAVIWLADQQQRQQQLEQEADEQAYGQQAPQQQQPAKPQQRTAKKAYRKPKGPTCQRCGGDGIYKKPTSFPRECWGCDGTGIFTGKKLKS